MFPRRRILRYLRRTAYVLLGLIVLVVAAVIVIAKNLDSDLIRRRLQSLVKEQAGLTLDYKTASVQILHGLTLGDVTIEQPEEFRAAAPLLLSVKQVSLGWAFLGKGSLLRKIKAEDVEVTLVTDENGRTSLDAIPKGEPKPPKPPVPPGKLLAGTLADLPGFDHITLARANLNFVRTEKGRVVERTRLAGLGGRIVSSGEDAARSITIDVGREKNPVVLTASIAGEGKPREAVAKLWLHVGLGAAGADVRVRAALDRQDLTPDLASKCELLTLDATAKSAGDRLVVSLDKLDALDNAVAAHARVGVGEAGAAVDDAGGTIDLGRLARLVPAKAALHVGLAKGHLKWSIAGLELGGVPKLDAKGKIEASATLSELRFEQKELSAKLAKLEWQLDIKPSAKSGTPHARISLRTGELALRSPDGNTDIGDTSTQLEVADVRFEPLSATVSLDNHVASLVAAAGPRTVKANDIGLRVHSKVHDGLPKNLSVELPIGKLELAALDMPALPPGPLHVVVDLTQLHVDPARPIASQAELQAELSGLGVSVSAKAHKRANAVDFDVKLGAPKLGPLAALAPPELALPQKMGATVAASGHLEQLSAAIPRGRMTVHAHFDDPAVTMSDSVFAARAFDLDLDGQTGGRRAFDVRLKLAPKAAAVDEDKYGDGVLALHAAYDPAGPAAKLEIDGSGDQAPRVKLALDAKWDRARKAVTYALDGKLANLDMLSTFLPDSLSEDHWIDLTDLEIDVGAHGDWTGLVTGFDRRGAPKLAKDPQAAAGDGSFELGLRKLKYVDAAGVEVTAPSVGLKTQLHAAAGAKDIRTDIELPRATVVAAGHKMQIQRLASKLETHIKGDPAVGPITASDVVTIGRVDQDFAPVYPIADASITLRAGRGDDGTLRLDALTIDNRGGGTHLALDGALVLPRTTLAPGPLAADAPIGFHSTEVQLRLEQKLDRLTGSPATFKGKGAMSLHASVGSGDLHRFHITANARFDGAGLELPDKKITLARIDGELPMVEDLLVLGGTSRLLPAKEDSNAYPSLRFADQHSFLSDRGALRVERIAVGDIVIDELAGNLRVKRDLVTIDHLEARLYGGHIAGQCLIVARGAESKITLHARATGIQAGADKERFDGNAALTLALGERALDGRVEIVRIGKQHLLSLLDEMDPHHADPGSNRIRTALSLGHPERVRLLFERGFASLHVEMGGLASIVSLSDVTGIPMGPLMEKYLGPALNDSEAKP